MARVDLLNVGKTLTERDRPAGRATDPGEGSPSSPSRRGASFSIENVTLTIHDGETLVVLGPSGCGKTSLLKIIAGLIRADSGAIRYDGVDVTALPPGQRRIGMVFQNYALYPHLTSRTNVLSYFLFRKKTPELDALARAKYERTSELMGVDLAHLLDRKPSTLSGGEKQRVALGRCITRDPALFLLDEPFSNLDQGLREKYRVNLKILLGQFNITTVYVTHDHHEAMVLADRLAVMNRGRIEQVGTYQEIYEEPANAFVAGFLSRHVGTPAINLLDGRHLGAPGGVLVGIRPEDLDVSSEPATDGIEATVAGALRVPLSQSTIVSARVADRELHALLSGAEPPRTGARVWLAPRRYHVFDKDSGRRLRSETGGRPPAALRG